MEGTSQDKIPTPSQAQILFHRIFIPGFVPSQYLYNRYAQYSINTTGDEKATYPLSKSEIEKVNKSKSTGT
jgi:hypothetical protein